MRHKKSLILLVIILGVALLAFGGYNVYRYSGLFRNMSDEVQSTEISAGVSESPPVYEYEQREIEVMNDGRKIYGVALIPKNAADKVPLVICAHGLGGNYRTNMFYAEQLASHGIAAYCFDFRGGGGNMSDGATTEMSVMTEVSDLETILEAAQRWDFADAEQISLLGTGQGGIVSAITAARHKDKIMGLVLLYPAFLVSDELHARFDSIDDVPESFWLYWITAGRRYAEDMWDFDVYEEIGNFENNVLLIHGSADNIVPLSYSEKALETYRSARLEVLPGAGHDFTVKTLNRQWRGYLNIWKLAKMMLININYKSYYRPYKILSIV